MLGFGFKVLVKCFGTCKTLEYEHMS